MNCFLNFRVRKGQVRLVLPRHACMFILSIACMIFQPANLLAQIGNIFGGTAIDISDAPYQVSVERFGGHWCGGAIINSEWVLTAGHCYDGAQPGGLMVHAGATDQTNNNIGQRVGVDQIIFHPNYTPFAGFTVATHDFALLHLSTPLCFNENVQPVVFATPTNTTLNDLAPGTATFITGWGDFGNGCPPCSDILLGAGLPIITNANANALITNPNNGCLPNGAAPVDNTMVSLFQEGIAAGPGDSGGPAVIEGPNEIPILIGVSSWGGCPRDEFPTMYANLRDFSDFITNNITQVAPPCACPAFITNINTNTLYNTDMDMPGDIHIHAGAELIIEATIGMRQGTRILVERNARLFINNGGVVTKGCDAPDWAGIQVLGNNQKVQPEHDGPLTDPDQAGIVWIDNGTVEWARTGVSAGGGYGPEFWGGVIWTNNNAVFQSNRKDVEFMQYKFGLNLNKSRFSNTRFLEGLPTVPYSNREGITIWETDGIEFDNCEIYAKGMQGIRTYDASIKVHNGCEIQGNNIGISSYATYPMSYKSVIGTSAAENNFYGNVYDIFASTATGLYGIYNPGGKFSMDVVNNNFEASRYGVVLDGPSNFRIGGNRFTDVEVNTWTAQTGYNNLINQNLIGCNQFGARRNLGILAIGDNKQMQFLGNDFVGGYAPARDFLLTNSWSYFANGAIQEIQGNPFVPAGNCFSDPGVQIDIQTWATTDYFTYYYESGEPPVDCDPEPLNPGNYGKVGVIEGIFGILCDQFGGLPEGLENPTDGDLNARRQQLQTLAPSIQTDPNAKIQYYQILAEKEAILKYLVSEALGANDYVTAESLLAGEQSKAAQWAIFGLRMSRQDYAGATQLLNQLPIEDATDTQFREIQLINLQRLQNPTGFELSAAQEAYLNSVADGYSPIRGYARGILGLLKDRVYYPDEYDISEERSSLTVRGGIDALKIYPVPASDQLVVTWPTLPESANAQILIFDLLGRQHFSQSIGAKETNRVLGVANLPEGVYFLVISDKGKVVHRNKFIVQH